MLISVAQSKMLVRIRELTLTERVAATCAGMAFFAALSGMMANRTGFRASYHKNDAILAQNIVTDEWAYYQSRNIRLEVATIYVQVAAANKNMKVNEGKLALLAQQKEEAEIRARKMEKERDMHNAISAAYALVGKDFVNANLFFQIALVLAPLTLLMKTPLFLWISSFLSLGGFYFFVAAYQGFFLIS